MAVEFFPRPQEQHEQSESLTVRLREELRGDLEAFGAQERPFVERWLEGEELDSGAWARFAYARSRWWQEKYGFPYKLRAEREEVLRRKYAPPEETARARALQEEFFAAMESGDDERIAELKQRYVAEFPDQLEGVEVLFAVRRMLEQQRVLDERREDPDYRAEREQYRDLTESQFLFTHFLVSNRKDKEMLGRFWVIAERVAKGLHALPNLNRLRRGLLSQVAAHATLDALGLNPMLSHPDEDAFRSVDLWAGTRTAVQVKGSMEVERPAVLTADTLAFPHIQTKHRSQRRAYSAKLFHDSQRFRAKLQQYATQTGRALEGFLLVIPYSKIDFITGKPAEELVEFFRTNLPPAGPREDQALDTAA